MSDMSDDSAMSDDGTYGGDDMSETNGDFEEVLLRFDMHHEMMYHEMCDVVATLRAENERQPEETT